MEKVDTVTMLSLFILTFQNPSKSEA